MDIDVKLRPWSRKMVVLVVFVLGLAIAAAPAVSGDFNTRKPTEAEMQGIMATIGKVFRGWGNLDLNLYMSAWSVDAHQYLKDGVERNYDQILSSRRNAFKKYREVHSSWRILDVDINVNTAYVSCYYEMTFVRLDGSSFNEANEEYYVLKYTPDGFWFIVENYDYLPKQ